MITRDLNHYTLGLDKQKEDRAWGPGLLSRSRELRKSPSTGTGTKEKTQYCWSPKEREEEKYLGSVSFDFLTVLSIAFGKGSWEMYVAEKG